MEKYIIELSEIRGKLLHAIDTKDELYAMMQVNNIDNLLYAMNEENKVLQASNEKSKLNLADVSGSYSAEDMSKAWSEGYHRKVDEINGNELRYFDVWLANYR